MTTVMTCGCFDLLHVGHLDTLEWAAAQGDRLIVLVDSDAMVRAMKGPRRPIHSQKARAELLTGLRVVDEVWCVEDADGQAKAIEQLQPDVFVKGADWIDRGYSGPLADALCAYDVELRYAPYRKGYSTTGILGTVA